MSLSTLLSELFSGADSETESPDATTDRDEAVPSVTVVYECRNCGTNVSAGTDRCPACESEDIASYSIE